MSKLYPDKTPEKTQVKCIDCQELDFKDMYCLPKKKDIQEDELYKPRTCRRYVR